MKIQRFEDAEVWRLARSYAKKVYTITENGPISGDYSFRDQLRRTAISIMANIAEGFERSSRKEFLRFLHIAKGSSGELRSHIYIAKDIGYIDSDQFDILHYEIVQISKSLGGFIKYLKTTDTT